jgi:hypothetical protein
MRSLSAPNRTIWAVILALLLSLRLVGAAGYMPAFESGRLTIVVCPGADDVAPLALNSVQHHRGHSNHAHGSCPYAAAASLSALGPAWTPLLEIAAFAAALLLGARLISATREFSRSRPPARGPPLPA